MEHDNENNNNQVIIINKREREETYLNELNNKVRENKVNNNNDNNNDNNNININNINNAETQKHSANLLTEVLEKRGGNLCIINVGSQNLRIGFASTFKTTASTSTGASSHSSENIERQQQQQQQQQQPFCFKHVCAYKKNKKTEHSIKKTSSSTTITKASDEEYVIANSSNEVWLAIIIQCLCWVAVSCDNFWLGVHLRFNLFLSTCSVTMPTNI